jgi:hypothetical protein
MSATIGSALDCSEPRGTYVTTMTMKGDERVEHLDLRRRRVASPDEAGVLAEIRALG